MVNNIIFILTEGDHDSAFIYRILKAQDAKTDNKVIKDYPVPLSGFFSKGFASVTIEDLNIQNTRSRFLPLNVMVKNQNTFLIYTIGGDSQSQNRVNLVKFIKSFNVVDPDAFQAIPGSTTFSVLFFFDADNKGVQFRIDQVKQELTEAVGQTLNIENAKIIEFEGIKLGAYIFTQLGEDKGMLEDILVPLMMDGNNDIFEAAESFLSIHEQTTLFNGKLTMDGSTIKKVIGQKYDYRKSLIGTVGQLQKSGKANTVCISDSDYLSKEKILNNATCNSIYAFIEASMI